MSGAMVLSAAALASGVGATGALADGLPVGPHEVTGTLTEMRHIPREANAPDSTRIRIVTAAALRHLREAGPEGRKAARILYDNPDTFIVLKPGQHKPHHWKAKTARLYDSYEALAAAARSGDLKGLDAVVYDNEHWNLTPTKEKQHAGKYSRKFANLAHKHGLLYIAAPAQSPHLFNADARYADIIDAQLQTREGHAGSYVRGIRHDVKAAHRRNKDIKVVTQITSNTNHISDTRAGVNRAIADIKAGEKAGADGFWAYVYQKNSSSIQTGVRILEKLARKVNHGVNL